MNNQQATPQKITLEYIARLKTEKLEEIRGQKKAMTRTAQRIFAPLAPATSQTDAIMRSFNTGMAIFDGKRFAVFSERDKQKLITKAVFPTQYFALHIHLHFRVEVFFL